MLKSTLRRHGAVAAAACLVSGAAITSLPMQQAHAATACDALTTPVHELVNPTTNAALLTTSSHEVSIASRYGFTTDSGAPFQASASAADGLVGIHRMYLARTGDFVWATDDDVATWHSYGYTDAGVGFWALPSSASCGTDVVRYQKKGAHHRFATTQAEQDSLEADGWTRDGVAFVAVTGKATDPVPPVTGDDQPFTIAVMPDTQQLVSSGSKDTRLKDETSWLAANASDLNLRFVQQVGDLTNWGWLVPRQRTKAAAGLKVLQDAKIPYQAAVGNHDTRAVGWDGKAGSRGYGGSGYQYNPECVERLGADQCRGSLLVRHTEEFNSTIKAEDMGAVVSQFEPGKVDNQYSEFSAGGRTWMVLQLELYPRTEAIDWAKQVVASHPDDNVIITTHSYLSAADQINTTHEYGTNSPKVMWDDLVSQYSNIKFVFSGHVGTGASRTDVGVHGNTVVEYLQNDAMDISGNPVRLLTVDPAHGTATSRVFDQKTGKNLDQFASSDTGLDLGK